MFSLIFCGRHFHASRLLSVDFRNPLQEKNGLIQVYCVGMESTVITEGREEGGE